MPLVNAHTHLELGWAATLYPTRPQPFPRWLERFMRRSRLAQQSDDQTAREQRAITAGIVALQEAGTTHIGDVTRSGLSIEPLLDSGLAGVVYIEILGLEEGVGAFMFERARQMLATYRPRERNGLHVGLALHSTYSTTAVTISQVAAFCQREDVPLCVHVAEAPAEVEALVHGRGPLHDLPRKLGGQTPPPAPRQTPLRYLADLGVLEARPLLVHAIQMDDDELDLVAQSGATVAHCPRSNAQLQMGQMRLDEMLARGIPVALGTESLAASPSLDVRAEAEVVGDVGAGLLGNTAVFGR